MTDLNLSSNCFKEIPDSISNIVHLRRLNLSNNHISELPSSFCDLSNLHALDLSNNNIVNLPKNFANLTLQSLKISKNRLIDFPSLSFKKLFSLNIDNNWIKYLPFDLRINLSELTSFKFLGLKKTFGLETYNSHGVNDLGYLIKFEKAHLSKYWLVRFLIPEFIIPNEVCDYIFIFLFLKFFLQENKNYLSSLKVLF